MSSNAEILGRFLRERRSRISPVEAGLPARRGGRSAGLTQEDLARLTGYSVRTISGLEQGVEHRPTPELLDAITDALHLSPEERHTLWYLAAQSPPPEREYSAAPDPGMAALVEAVDPHPALVYDLLWNIQTHNDAFAVWHGLDPGRQADNLAKLVFLDDHFQHVYVDWETELAPAFMDRIRAVRARLPHNRQLTALIEEICDRSPVARRFWEDRDSVYAHPPSVVRRLRSPGRTDPEQPDDARHQVAVIMTVLASTRPADERRLVVYTLPAGCVRMPLGTCTACARV